MSKLTFAKVAASSYNPTTKTPSAKPTVESATNSQSQPPVKITRPKETDIPTVSKRSIANATRLTELDRTSDKPVVKPNASDVGDLKQNQDDRSTQISSDDSIEPLSFDTKSVASAATFALDEKESIRPDDSASMRAVPVEEEELFSPPGSVIADSRAGSDNAARAFREQLDEIAHMSAPAPRPVASGFTPAILSNPAHAQANVVLHGNAPLPSDLSRTDDLPASPDDALLEAVQSPKDRLWILKLEQDIIDFIVHSKEPRLTLPQCHAFYRKLAHQLADYYRLDHNVEQNQTGAAVVLIRTDTCKIVAPLSQLPTSSTSNTPPVNIPKRKIMRRPGDPRTPEASTAANSEGPSAVASAAGSEVGVESSSNSDYAPNQPCKNDDKSKFRPTHEERAAKYKEARLRIFGQAEAPHDALESVADEVEAADSRASSTTGKRKTQPRKQRTMSNDDFEPRSQFPGYMATPYTGGNGYQPNQPYYNQFQYGQSQPHPMHVNANPVAFPGSQHVPNPEPQPTYPWPPQPSGMPVYHQASSSYDISTHFRSGMQSFQNAPPNHGPNMLPTSPPNGYSNPSQWTTPVFDQYGRPVYPHAINDRSVGVQPQNGSYSFSQYPQYPYAAQPKGVPPVTYNRLPYGPQTQSFVPGHHHTPSAPQPPLPTFPNYPMQSMVPPPQPVTNHMNNRQQFIPRPFHHAPVGPSQGAHAPPLANSNSTQRTVSRQQNGVKQVPGITAKWGTPSHLPAKPPTPQTVDPNLAGLPVIPNLAANTVAGGPGDNQASAARVA